MASSTMSFYSPLNPDNFEIRLASVENASDGTISCQLETVSLRDEPLYGALSYVWGDQSVKETILVNGQEFSATVNLAAALQKLGGYWEVVNKERSSPPFRIWIDALCINQEDTEERNRQIQLMGYIYYHANPVFVWLGTDEGELGFALFSLEKISMHFRDLWPQDEIMLPTNLSKPQSLEHLGKLFETFSLSIPDSGPKYIGDIIVNSWPRLLDAAYWSRAWVVQESVLSQRMVLCSRDYFASFEELMRAATIMDSVFHLGKPPRPHCIEEKEWESICRRKLPWSNIFRLSMLKVGSSADAQKALSQLPPKLLEFSPARVRFLMGSFMPLNATDPKDRVYALSSLSGLGLTPSYSDKTPVCKPFVDYARSWAAKISADQELRGHDTSRLEFLREAGTGVFEYEENFPTWAPNLPLMRYSEVGLSQESWCAVRDALKGVDHDIQITETQLTTHGAEVQRISNIMIRLGPSPKHITPIFCEFFKNFVQKWPRYPTNIPPLQAFIRLVKKDFTSPVNLELLELAVEWLSYLSYGITYVPLANETETNQSLIVDGLFLLKDLFAMMVDVDVEQLAGWLCDSLVDESELVGLPKTREDIISSIESVFVPTVERKGLFSAKLYAALINIMGPLRLFETEQGFLGICPVGTEPGDIICLLCGSNAPIILRKKDNGYIHVGSCTILGFLNDEVSMLIDEGKLSIQKFVIH